MSKTILDVIAFDADDTLWVNEPFYQDAEKKLEDMLRKYVDAQSITEILYDTEKKNLSLFGYGAKGFTISMIETAIEISGEKISAGEIQQIIELGKTVMNNPIDLLPHVAKVIPALTQQFRLMLLTKGDLFDQESKIARSGLADYFDDVEIVSEKDEETYRRLLGRYEFSPERFLMVGNSLKSDILPLVKLGCQAVHIPYKTTWVHEQVSDAEKESEHYYELASMGDFPALIAENFESAVAG